MINTEVNSQRLKFNEETHKRYAFYPLEIYNSVIGHCLETLKCQYIYDEALQEVCITG